MTFQEILDKSLNELYRFAEDNGYGEWCDVEELAASLRINQTDKLALVLTEMAKIHIIEAEGVDLKHEFTVEKVRIAAHGLRLVEEGVGREG